MEMDTSSKKKVLVVDDQPGFGEMIKINLESQGPYEVDICFNGLEGVQKVKENRYDIILLDVLMPKMEGHVAIHEIKKICNTPVIIMSAYLSSNQKLQIRQAGAVATLEKPVKMDTLIATIKMILKL